MKWTNKKKRTTTSFFAWNRSLKLFKAMSRQNCAIVVVVCLPVHVGIPFFPAHFVFFGSTKLKN